MDLSKLSLPGKSPAPAFNPAVTPVVEVVGSTPAGAVVQQTPAGPMVTRSLSANDVAKMLNGYGFGAKGKETGEAAKIYGGNRGIPGNYPRCRVMGIKVQPSEDPQKMGDVWTWLELLVVEPPTATETADSNGRKIPLRPGAALNTLPHTPYPVGAQFSLSHNWKHAPTAANLTELCMAVSGCTQAEANNDAIAQMSDERGGETPGGIYATLGCEIAVTVRSYLSKPGNWLPASSYKPVKGGTAPERLKALQGG